MAASGRFEMSDEMRHSNREIHMIREFGERVQDVSVLFQTLWIYLRVLEGFSEIYIIWELEICLKVTYLLVKARKMSNL